jgi:hypothetical protein
MCVLLVAVTCSLGVWVLNKSRRTALKTGIFKLGPRHETDRAKHPWEFRAFMLWWWIVVPLCAVFALVAWIGVVGMTYIIVTEGLPRLLGSV